MDTAERHPERWLKPCEVSDLFEAAGLFRVPASTLRDWVTAGRLAAIRTAGGHRRIRESDARALLSELGAVA